MKQNYLIKNETIIINRKLTGLDNFVRDFLEIFKKHSDYLIVSGFVSISTGRIRGTEDIDVLMPLMSKEKFKALFKDLIKNKFWCYQADDVNEVYSYLEKKSNIRFARVNEMFPNMEVIPITPKRKAKYYEFTHPQKIKIENFEFKIPPIEFEILYKEKVLAAKKDIEDAAHLRVFFKDILNKEKFLECDEVIKYELQ